MDVRQIASEQSQWTRMYIRDTERGQLYMTMTILAMLFLLELQLDWQPKASYLTIQDVREILEVILPKREMNPDEILRIIQQKHKARLSARRSKHRKYETEHKT